MERVRLFTRKSELAVLSFPLLFAPLIAMDFYFGWSRNLDSSRFDLYDFVLSFVFLDHLHIALTFLFVGFLPELQPWRHHHGRGSDQRFWTKALVGFGAIFVMLLWIKAMDPIPIANWGDWPKQILKGLVVIASPYHTLMQSRGLSLAYGSIVAPHAAENSAVDDRLKANATVERWLFNALFATLVILVFSRRGFPIELPRNFSAVDWQLNITTGSFAGSLVFALLILINSWRNPLAPHSWKSVFLLRILIWPFVPLCFTALFAVAASHGIEYVCVFRKLIRGSQLSPPSRRWLGLAIGLALLSLFAMRAPVYFFPKVGIVELLATFGVALSLLHYYWDRQLFLMRLPLNRNTSGKLLMRDPKQESHG